MASGRGTTTAPLVRLVDGRWKLVDAGAALLAALPAPLCVVACAGMYRTGKSFFLNSLAGSTCERASLGFKVGSTSESCTRGIDVCLPDASASLSLKCGGTLVLLDTEGIASMDQDESYDAQVFAIGLLLSSYFVLNSMGVIDEAAIDRLYLVAELTKHISVHAAGGHSSGGEADETDVTTVRPALSELSQHFPPLLWLLRDFVLDLTADGRQISEQEYMENALAERPTTARRADERNAIRRALRELFPKRTCRTLVRPVSNEDSLRDAVQLAPEQLRPEFVRALTKVKSHLLEEAPVKRMFGAALDGAMLLALARQYLEAMNTPMVVPSIKSAWEFVVAERCAAAAQSALDLARSQLGAAVASSPLLDAAGWEVVSRKAEVAAWARFKQQALDGEANASSRADLKTRLSSEVTSQRAALWTASRTICDAAAAAAAAYLPSVEEMAGSEDVGALAAAVGGAVDVYEAGAQGPEAATGLAQMIRSQLVPWLERVAAALEAARLAAASAAAADLAAERNSKLQVEGMLAASRAEATAMAEVSRQLEARILQLEQRVEEGSRREETLGEQLHVAQGELRELRDVLHNEQMGRQRDLTEAARLQAEAERAAASELAAAQREAMVQAEALRTSLSTREHQLTVAARDLVEAQERGERELRDAMERAAAMEEGLRRELEGERSAAAQRERELEQRLEAAEAERELARKHVAELEAARVEADARRKDAEEAAAAAVEEANLLRRGADAATAEVQTLRAEAEVVCATAKAKAAEELNRMSHMQEALMEERDALKAQLADFHERLAILPEFYVQQVFSGEKPEDLVSALTDPPSIDPSDLPSRAEGIAAAHLGNIAAVASLAVSRATPLAKRTWARWMGPAEEQLESPPSTPVPSIPPPPATPVVPGRQ